MSDAYDEESDDLFEIGEMIVLTLKDGRHYLGEYVGLYDTGIAMKVEAKTAFRVEKVEDSKFETFVKSRIQEEMSKLVHATDWLNKALQLNPDQKDILKLSQEQIRDMVSSQIHTNHRKWAKELWQGPIQEQDVTKPYLREMKRSVRTLVTWAKIDEVCSAHEMAEEAEIADLSNLIDNGEFFKLIDGLTEEK